MSTNRSTEGMPMYPKEAPPSRVVRGRSHKIFYRAVKGAFHELVSSSCTSGKNGTGGGRWEPARPPLRNYSFWHTDWHTVEDSTWARHERSAAQESIAVISGSGSDNATTPEGGNAAESSSPERERESPPMQRSTSGHQGSPVGIGWCTPHCRGPSPIQWHPR